MPTSSSVFRQKQVYHSDLRQVSPISISLLSHPRKCKYPDRLPYCKFAVEGEVGTWELAVENDSVRNTLLGMNVGEYYTVAAAGTRGDAALHIIAPSESEDVTLPFPDAPRTAPDVSPEPPRSAPQNVSLARAYFAALEASAQIVSTFRDRHGRVPSETERAVAACLFIEGQRNGGRTPLTSPSGGE